MPKESIVKHASKGACCDNLNSVVLSDVAQDTDSDSEDQDVELLLSTESGGGNEPEKFFSLDFVPDLNHSKLLLEQR